MSEQADNQLLVINKLFEEFSGTILESNDYRTSEIIPLLFVGAFGDVSNVEELKTMGITHILSVGTPPELKNPEKYFKHKYDFPLNNIFEEAFGFLRDAIINEKGGVIVHCVAGMSRSVTVATAFLMEKEGWTAEYALKYVQSKRKCACPNMGFLKILFQLESSLIAKTYNYKIETKEQKDNPSYQNKKQKETKKKQNSNNKKIKEGSKRVAKRNK